MKKDEALKKVNEIFDPEIKKCKQEIAKMKAQNAKTKGAKVSNTKIKK